MSTTSRIKAAMLFQLLLIALLALVITGETGVSEGDFWLLAAAGLLALATLPILLYAQNEVLAHNEEDINLDIPIHTPPSINPEAEKEAIIQQITKDLGYSFQNIVDALVKGETEQAKRLAQPQVFAAGVDQLAALVQQLQDRRRQDQKHLGLMHFMTRALDKIDAKVMIADHDLNILYTNQAVRQLLQDREANIRQQLPNFNARKLVGTNIDVFHANPQHQRQLLAQLQDRHQAKINVGGCTFSFCVNALYNKQDERMGFVVEWHDLTDQLASQEREQAQQKALEKVTQENTRIRFALDKVSTNIMIADEQYDIIYINQAVQNMFAKCADQLRQVIPHFDAHHLLGVNIDSFHKHPQHQRQMLAALRDTYKTQIQLAGRSFRLIANPIINSEQQRCGTVVEWADVTNEVAAEQEIADIVIQAAAGDFSGRIQLEGKEGFFLQLGQSLNRLLEITSEGLEDVAEVLSAIAEGDLTHRIDKEYQGTFLRLKEDTNQTVEQLCRIVGQIKESTDAINTAASEIAAGNNDLSQRTEEQASSLQETAASMEQITSTVQQNADNARQANQLAIGASDVAERGGQVVNDVVKTMQMITSSSRQIEEIITVIDSIAFQTNILALNAAVEAARAGEQGRGFAVVATEVRNLARRSADAAKEIKALINKSVETVESSSHLVTDAGHTMSEIVTAVKRVTDIMAEISAASDEQRSGIEQINLAITQLDEVTQQNAALVEEAAAASEAAEEQARNLSEAIAFFRVDENAQVRAPLALQAPPGHQPHKTHAAVPSTPVKTPPLPAPRKEMDADEGWEEF